MSDHGTMDEQRNGPRVLAIAFGVALGMLVGLFATAYLMEWLQ